MEISTDTDPATQAISIQPATPTDLEVLLPMVEQYWRFEAIEGFDATRMRKLLTRVLEDSNLGRAWLATLYGEPAGYLLAVYVFSLEHQGLTAEIDEFFVVPAHRGLGWAPDAGDRRSAVSPRGLHQCLAAARAQQRGGAKLLSAPRIRRSRGL